MWLEHFAVGNLQQIQIKGRTRLLSICFRVEAFVLGRLGESLMLSFFCKVTAEVVYGRCSQEEICKDDSLGECGLM